MNKKLIALTLALALLCMAATAFAVPSKTTQDMTVPVAPPKVQNDVVVSEKFVLAPAAPTTEAVVVLEEIKLFVTKQIEAQQGVEQPKVAPIEFFKEETKAEVAKLLPEEFALDTLEMNEFTPVALENYDSEYGDVVTAFKFATEYKQDQQLVAMLGIMEGVDEAGKPIITWIPLVAEVTDLGTVEIHFTKEALEAIGDKEPMIAILSEPVPEAEV